MSTRKVTAFARKPRGTASGAAPSGGPSLIINGALFQRFNQARMDPNLKQVLNKTASSLNININASGQAAVTITNGKKVIANQDDINKVSAMGSYINEQRKLAMKETVNTAFKKMLYALRTVSKENAGTGTYIDPVVPRSFLDIYRPIASQMMVLNHNMSIVEKIEIEGDTNLEYFCKQFIEGNFTRISNAVGEFLIAKFNGLAKDKKLNEYLYRRNCPIWVYQRLTNTKMAEPTPTFKLSSIVFPKDPTKGLSLTFKEIRTSTMVNNQFGILRNNAVVVRFFQSDEVIRTFCNIPVAETLENDTPLFQTLASVPILMLNPVPDALETVSLAAKKNGQAYGWENTVGLNPKNSLKFLGTVFKRTFALALPKVLQQVTLIERLFPAFKYDRSKADRNLLQQVEEFLKGTTPTPDLTQFECYTTVNYAGSKRVLMRDLLAVTLAITEATNPNEFRLISDFNDVINTEGNSAGITPLDKGILEAFNAYKVLVDRAQSFDQMKNIDEWVSSHFEANLATKERKEISANLVATALTKSGSSLIRFLNMNGYAPVAVRIDRWLRTFMSHEVQAAVAELMAAKFDDFFKKNIDYSRDDLAGFMDIDFEMPEESEGEEEIPPAEEPEPPIEEASSSSPTDAPDDG